jgi:serine/threonine protein kinase
MPTQKGVVHRDVKPANVLVDVRGRVKVTDFGLARLNGPSSAEQAGYTMTGTVLGTPDYMAPEQKRGMHVDHRADIYSLGVMLYEMLCGQVPQGVFDLPSRLVSVDEAVDQVVVRAMQQEPDRRYQNTADMKHEVQTIRVAKNPNALAPQPKREQGTSKRTVAIAAALVAVAGAVAYMKIRDPDPVLTSSVADSKESRRSSTRPTETSNSTAETPSLTAVEPVKPTEVATPKPEPKPAATASTEPKVAIAVPSGPSPRLSAPDPVAAPPPSALPPAATTIVNNSRPVAAPAAATPSAPAPAFESRPVANPDLASAVAQLGPNTSPKPIPLKSSSRNGSASRNGQSFW